MKNRLYILAILFGILTFPSCSLDEFPGGDTVSEEQRNETSSKDPSKIIVMFKGVVSNYIKFDTLEEDGGYHTDFGYASLCQFIEMYGQDFYSIDHGYNWYRSSMFYRDKTLNSSASELMWRVYYNVIKASNDIIEAIPSMIENATEEYLKNEFELYLSQGYVNRAFAYFQLIQTYQFTYKGNEDKPGVPLVLAGDDPRATGKRATVQEVYDVILDDIEKALPLLEGKQVPDKSYANQQVVYGLLAKVSLVMNNWKVAAESAKKAQQGYTPYSINEVSVPSFNDSKSTSWMWANLITETNDIVLTGIINWPSQLSSFTGNGYTTAGAYRSINSNLWNKIPENDVRKHSWWTDKDSKAPFIDNLIVRKGTNEGPIAEVYGYAPYTNIKFGAYQNQVLNTLNASDWVMMRVEEMILIEAEALAMDNRLGEAKQVLSNFLNTYRYEGGNYVSEASSPEQFQDEIWLQRRIELWGEGFAFFDLMRLKKPLTRIENGQTSYPANGRFNIKYGDPIFLPLIPQKEIEASSELTQADNNPLGVAPQAEVEVES